MNQPPVFTVIVPTYNREHFLKRAVDSILAQTFQEFELIIIDDGSTDDTRKLVETYKDDRIIYIYKENGGLNSARNKGLSIARGKYIAFCDSDDSWLPQKLEKHIQKYQEDDEVGAVYDLTGITEIRNGEMKIVLARNDVCEGWCYKQVLEQGYLTSPTFLSCKKECFDKTGMMSMELTNCEDDDFCFRLCKYFKIGLVKEILGIYYSDASNRISFMSRLCADDFLKFVDMWSTEVTEVCGKKILKHKYYKAVKNYLELNDMAMAKKVYQKACRTGDISVEEVKNIARQQLFIQDEIIIYGLGEWGEKVYRLFRLLDFEKFICVLTDTAQGPEEWHGLKVKEIRNLNGCMQIPVFIASTKYYDDMKSMAEQEGFVHIFSIDEIINIIFDE